MLPTPSFRAAFPAGAGRPLPATVAGWLPRAPGAWTGSGPPAITGQIHPNRPPRPTRRPLATIAVVVALVATGAAADWPMFRFGPTHGGRNSGEAVLSTAKIGRAHV